MDYNTASDSIIMICCLLHRYLVVSNLLPSRYSYRMLRAAGRSSQTSKIQNFPFGVMDVHFRPTVNDLSYEVQWSSICILYAAAMTDLNPSKIVGGILLNLVHAVGKPMRRRIIGACWMVIKMAKSMADTGEIEAIAWLLKTTPHKNPAVLFKKAG